LSQTVQVQRKRKPGRPKVLDTSIETRVPWADYFLVAAVAFFERRDSAELMRMWINEKRKKYRRDPEFKRWLERHADELQKMGIPLAEIW
jgi:hypothetical protein